MRPFRPRKLKYDEADEHILRRIAGSVLVMWPELPKDLQDRLMNQASLIEDRHFTVQLRQQIEIFVDKQQDAIDEADHKAELT